jgi:hypothetical protein
MQGLTYSLRPPRYQRLMSSSSVKEIKSSFYQGEIKSSFHQGSFVKTENSEA